MISITGIYHWYLSLVSITGIYHWYLSLVSITGIYHWYLSPGPVMTSDTGTAKLFKHGRSQAVRLPKEFRMPGTEVRVRRIGRGVLLEPIDVPFDIKAWFAKIDEYLHEP